MASHLPTPGLRLDTWIISFGRAKVHSNTVVTTDDWSLMYAAEAGKSELYHLASDPGQELELGTG